MDKGEKDMQFYWIAEPNEQQPVATKLRRRVGPKKLEFVGWGSKALIEFLEAIGKLTDKQLSQYEVAAIINDYIRANNLLHPEKKKRVVCDEWLHYLFGKKSVARNKIYDLLEMHFTENHDDSEDELLYSSEENEENFMTSYKKQKISSLDKKAPWKKKQEPETSKSCFAAIISDNLKLVYLRRSLFQDLLKDPESFEGKVIGSYVRIKSDPNDYFQKNSHQLLQVTGVRRASGRDDVGTEILIQLPNLIKDVPICMLSDENFSEEECEDLRQRVKAGLLKRPTVVELEQKAGILHEDITKQWLAREIVLLQNLIDRANEKGWRRELFEYLERKQLLQTPSEQSRLLLEVPKVIAEELEMEVTPQDPTEDTKREDTCSPKSIVWEATDISIDFTNKTLSTQNYASTESTDAAGSKDVIIQSQITSNSSIIKGNQDLINKITSVKTPGIQDALGTYKQDNKMEAQPANYVEQPKKQALVVMSNETQMVNAEERKGLMGEKKVVAAVSSQVIELSDDDDNEEEARDEGFREQEVDHPASSIWFYLDPQGNIQGPFSMNALKRWRDANFFSPGFKVWKTGQTQGQAVLLADVLRLMFP